MLDRINPNQTLNNLVSESPNDGDLQAQVFGQLTGTKDPEVIKPKPGQFFGDNPYKSHPISLADYANAFNTAKANGGITFGRSNDRGLVLPPDAKKNSDGSYDVKGPVVVNGVKGPLIITPAPGVTLHVVPQFENGKYVGADISGHRDI